MTVDEGVAEAGEADTSAVPLLSFPLSEGSASPRNRPQLDKSSSAQIAM
ncbi:hypothetical protein [Paenibacillus soyae]|uniref:Uncharacterized protein n=1 Tax=Paenibacillus soyae TaxID=2969249 RepID=A0A9X2MTZ6_9BACL|nr:hypothetical protein [Paenibacillus soyae]MCR2806445.1 hypothetical protein [Paenibacillus soyae]